VGTQQVRWGGQTAHHEALAVVRERRLFNYITAEVGGFGRKRGGRWGQEVAVTVVKLGPHALKRDGRSDSSP
jgi:hypothetical protein